MEKTINRAMNSINQLLDDSSEYEDTRGSKLNDIHTLFKQLLESDLPPNDLTRLFCRQMNRLMDYNQSFSEEFWISLSDDILYVIQKQNSIQCTSNIREDFLKRINLEEKLMQRELEFQQIFGRRKCLTDLFDEHQTFFEEYLQKCIVLHSKIQVQGLVKDLNDFLDDICELNDFSLTRKDLNEKLNCITVSVDCSTRVLIDVHSELFDYSTSQQRVKNSSSDFIPSAVLRFNQCGFSQTFLEVLKSERWLVILGDPGSGKTSLLRWITWIFAEAAYSRNKEIVFEEKHHNLVRIPIFIQLGEFAVWFEQNPQKTLMDYIGKHTWFSRTYIQDESGIILRELIDHGHALILIDGLDEILESGQKQKIVDVVQKFIDQYIVGSDFLSTSDDPIFKNSSKYYYEDLTETSSPNMYNGNQVIVTSRYVGYHVNPLNSVFIRHYLLSLIDHQESKEFVNKWMIQVEKSIVDILINEGMKIDKEIIDSASKRRADIVKEMFDTSSEFLLSNPSLLSLICTLIFQSSDQTEFKSRVQLYYNAVQAAFTDQKCKESGISKSLLYEFLINLASYLHLQSPSGLIDEFDMERLCCLTLRQQNVSSNRNELCKTANQLINLLKSNNGIVDERGLQIFGFLHLSFQEYFVAQLFIKVNSSIENLVEYILTFTINPRFRQSLLMALGLISWKWSSIDYDQFCRLLVTSNHHYAIPLGTLLFFDAINDMQTLPSNSIIYSALNSLLDHPYNIIAKLYFIPNLSKLNENVIREWMQLYLRDDKRLCIFCKCLYITLHQSSDVHKINLKSIIPLIYQQLSSFSNVISTSNEFFIDQIFRRLTNSDHILHNELSVYFSSNNICVSDIHPLILSAIIAVCGGIYFESKDFIVKTNFSSNYFHHKSSIIEYLMNNKESHSTRIEILIKRYETVLGQTSLLDTSIDIVDTFVALICLKGLSKLLIYQEYQALSLAFDRLKRTWFYLKQPFRTRNLKYYTVDTSPILTSEIESIIKTFLSQTDLSDRERIVLSLACSAALNKLCTECSLESIPFDMSLIHNATQSLGFPLDLSHFARNKQYQIYNNIHLMEMFREESYFLLTFVPQSLQKLYYCMIIDVPNKTDSSSHIIFLSQCLILLENVRNYDPYFDHTLSMLQSELKEYKLENYGLMLRDKNSIVQLEDYDTYIDLERQRISVIKNARGNKERDLQLFAASITLAKIFQTRENQSTKNQILSSVQSTEVCATVASISDLVLRIIALSIILDMEKPLIFDEEKSDELKSEMVNTLQSVLPTLSLLTSTLLFIRCYKARQHCPQSFHQMTDVIGRKLNETSMNTGSHIQEAVFIALHHLNNSDLSPYLSECIKQTKANLSDLLQFNSSVFFHYFTNTTYDIQNSVLVSIMYLTELAFDAQHLKMNITNNHKDRPWSLKQWKLLWCKSSANKMTLKMAIWITNYLQSSSRAWMYDIIEDISKCLMIEKKSLSEIKKWLDYRTEKYLRFFAHYAALQLLIEGLDIPDLTDIITEIFDTDKKFCFIPFIEHLFNSELINLTTLREILIKLNQNVPYSSEISLWINRKEILELVLSLELKRTISNTCPSVGSLTNSFLSMIFIYSDDLPHYLLKYLRTFTNEQNKVEDIFNEEYIAVLIRWIIKMGIRNEMNENFLCEFYQYSFTYLHDQRFPQMQKAILHGLNLIFIHCFQTFKEHLPLLNDLISNLEKIICFSYLYSKDVLSICLLTYGNCLLQLRKFQTNYYLSYEIRNVFIDLFQSSLLEIISIRAAFCLIITDELSITFDTISNWMKNKSKLTHETKYHFLLQRPLYKWDDYLSDGADAKKVAEHINIHSNELLNKFVLEFYNYLSNKCCNNYLSDLEPNYINVAMHFIEINFNSFRSAIQRSCFGEDQFKRQLYLYYMKNPKTSSIIVRFYAAFGALTVDMIEMLTWINDTSPDATWQYLKDIKQVSNREVIEQLFQQVDLNLYNTKLEFFISLLKLLVQLVQVHVVSSLEVHQKVSIILDNLSREENFEEWPGTYDITRCLLNLSCIEQTYSFDYGFKLCSENDIDEDFERTIQMEEKKSSLFLRRDYFSGFF